MAKSMFEVVVIHKGRERDYYDFWIRNIRRNDSGEEINSALVGFVEFVEAKNSNEANLIVRKKYPGHQIDTQATKRHSP